MFYLIGYDKHSKRHPYLLEARRKANGKDRNYDVPHNGAS